ncbi:U-box domain-containing protein 12 [Hordeum vulgare]|nr:U-box domain-containing protein 12 [Hordeum vulgare]
MANSNDLWERKLQDPSATPVPLPFEFLKAVTCDISSEQELGRGGHGVVYKGVLPSGKIIAVKKLLQIHLMDDEKFENEAQKKEVNKKEVNRKWREVKQKRETK